ncbi:MAG: hypothetical protein NVS3B7_05630 [Candidatus Elarobacter sp.]
MVLSGCGRQVTGLNAPSAGVIPAGQTLIRFETAAQPDYDNVRYLIVINTQGNQNEPYALGYNSNYTNWSMVFIIGGGAGFAQAPQLRQIYQDPTNGNIQPYTISYPQNFLNFQPSLTSAASPFGFQLTFNRCILDRPAPTGNPPTSGKCPPYTYISSKWAVNLFTVDRTDTVVDSLGPFANDTTAKFTFDTTATITNQSYIKPATNTTLRSPATQITGIEVFNTP